MQVRSLGFIIGRIMAIMFGALVILLALMALIVTTNQYQLAIALVFVAAAFCLLFFLFTRQVQQTVITPLAQIAATIQRVALYKDFSLRVSHGQFVDVPREIVALTDAFNSMLDEVEDRDTKLLRKTRELEKSKQSAETANIAKSQFLANMSHELRTPLNSIIGFSTMMKDQQLGAMDAQYQRYSEDIYDSGTHLLEIINDILDLSKIEAGKLQMNYQPFALEKVIAKALNMLAERARQGVVVMEDDMPERMPKMVGDKVRMLQIMLNLISNAVKFSPENSTVKVSVKIEEGNNHVHYFSIEVADQGVGMSEADIVRAYDAFTQGDAGLNRQSEGTGLGLALTKRLVELHNGTINIESVKDSGTTVKLHILSDPALLD